MGETASARLFPISLKPTSPVVGGPNHVLRKFVEIKGNRQRRAWHPNNDCKSSRRAVLYIFQNIDILVLLTFH